MTLPGGKLRHQLLIEGSAHDVFIARGLLQHPDKRLLPALQEALERAADDRTQKAIERAIEACQGRKPTSRPSPVGGGRRVVR